MNKIYKVIYNKARNCYVVASEIAKSTSKSSSGSKKKAAALLCAAILSGGISASAATLPSVTYDDDTKAKISLGENGNTVDISGVTGGQVYKGSTFAATGDDVYQIDQKISKFQSRLDTVDLTTSTINATLSTHTLDINTLKNTTATLSSKVERGYNFQIDGFTIKNATPGSNDINFEKGNHVSITNDSGSIKFSINDNGSVADGNKEYVTGGTVYTAIDAEKTERQDEDTKLSNRIGTLDNDGEYVKKANSVSTNLTALDKQVKANADAIADEATTRANEITKAKDELSASISSLDSNAVKYDDFTKAKITLGTTSLKTTITNLAAGALTADSTDAVNGSQLFATNANITQEIQDRKDAIAKEVADRDAAIKVETDARTAADTAITNKIGSLTKDGSYIQAQKSVSDNLSALDSQVSANEKAIGAEKTARENAVTNLETKLTNTISSLDSNAVKYDDTTKAKITLGTTSLKTTITNLQDATLSATSSDAVTGKQLFTTNANIAQEIQDRKDAIVKEVTDRDAADTKLSDRIGTIEDNGEYVKKANSVSSNLTALDKQVKANADAIANEATTRANEITKAKEELSNSISSLDNNAVKYDDVTKAKITLGTTSLKTTITNLAAGALTADSTDAVNGSQLFATNANITQEIQDRKDAIAKEVTDRNTAIKAETDARIAAIDDIKNNKLGTTKSGSYIQASNTVADNLTALDTQVKNNADAIGTEKNDRENAITNLETKLTNTIKSLDSNAVQYTDATKDNIELGGKKGTIIGNVKAGALTADSMEAVNGSQLYATNTKITQEIQDRKDAIAKEVTDRDSAIKTAVKAESDARTSDINTINSKLGTIAKDGAYIVAADTVSNNLVKLDTGVNANKNAIDAETAARKAADSELETRINKSLSSLEDNAVRYSDSTKDTVKLGGGEGTKITNLKAGTLTADSTDAVNGSQLYESNRRITNNAASISEMSKSVNSLRTSVNTNSNAIDTLNTKLTTMNSSVSTTIKNLSELVSSNANQDLSNISQNGTETITAVANKAIENYMQKYKNALSAQNSDIATMAAKYASPVATQATPEAVYYDDEEKNRITLGENKSTVDIVGVTGGQVYEGSTHAATGNDVYVVDKKISAFQSRLDTVDFTTSTINATLSSHTLDINTLKNNTATLSSKVERGYSLRIDGNEVKNATPSDNILNFKPGENVAITNEDGSIKISAEGDGVIGKGNTGLISGDTAYKALNEKANKDMSNLTDKAKDQIKNVMSADLATKANVDLDNISDAGIQKVKDIVSADMNLKADTSLSNLTNDGVSKIKNLAKGSVKVIDGNGTTVSSSYDDAGNISYAVNIATGDLTQGGTGFVTADAVKYALSKKANRDASNIDADKYAEKLGTGTVADGDTSLVTGSTVYNAIKDLSGGTGGLITKINVDMDNISSAGKTVIKNLAKDAVKVADGKYTTVTNETDKDGNITYHVNVTADGAIEAGNNGLITGDTAKKALDAKANTDLDNISDAGKDVIKNTVKDDLDKKADRDLSNLTDAAKDQIKNTMSADLEGKANIDASNVGKFATEWASALGTGKVEKGNKNLVTGDTVYSAVSVKADKSYVDTELAKKANTEDVNTALDGKADKDLSNISDAGKDVIKNTVKDDLDKKADRDLSNLTDAAKDQIKNTMSADLEGKANIDASNVGKYATEWASAIGTGKIEKGNKNLVTGDTVYSAVSVKADKSYVDTELSKKANADEVNAALAGKANSDLSNISDAGKNVIKDTMKADLDKKADKDYVDNALAGKVDKSDFDTVKNQVDKNTADIANKADKSYVDDALSKKADADKVYTKEETDAKIDSKIDSVKDAINSDLENKVNKDASNIEKDKWQEALGDGVNEKGNTGLITGDTLHTALDNLKDDGLGLVRQDGDTITVGANADATKVDFKGKDKDGNSIDRVLTGIKTDENDMSSATNVGYVQGVASNLESQMDYMNGRLTNDIKEAGAVASALAGLHHIDYDPDNKLDFAVATAGYRGKSAAALGVFYQPNENVMFSLAGTIGSSHNAWNAGVSFKIGHGSDAPVLSRRVLGNRITALAEQNQYLAERNEKLEQDVRDMQNKLNALLAAIDVSKDVQKDMTAPATK